MDELAVSPLNHEDVAMNAATRGWLVDLLIGGLAGGIAGAIAAVNVVIYSGIDDGYEASIPEVFRQNAVVGVIVVIILIMGPVGGVIVARRRRRSRLRPGSE